MYECIHNMHTYIMHNIHTQTHTYTLTPISYIHMHRCLSVRDHHLPTNTTQPSDTVLGKNHTKKTGKICFFIRFLTVDSSTFLPLIYGVCHTYLRCLL